MRKLEVKQNKKLRGKGRKLQSFIQALDCIQLPKSIGEDKYWNYKIPIDESLLFVNKRLTKRILKEFILKTQALYKASSYDDAILTLVIANPNLFSSELCIFFDNEYFANFTQRDNEYQKWEPSKKGVLEVFNIEVSSELKVLNFDEIINDDDFHYTGKQTVIIFP